MHKLRVGISFALGAALLEAFNATLSPAQAQQIVRGGATGTNLTISTLTTGTILDVTPSVSPDGRYVGLRMKVSQSSLDGIDTFTSGFSGTGTGGGPLASSGVGPLAGERFVPFGQAPAEKIMWIESDKALLARPVPTAKQASLSLKEAVKQISTQSKTNLALSTNALKLAQIDVNQTLAVDLPAQTLKERIEALLTLAAPRTRLVVTADDGVVFITTLAQADMMIVTKTYYVADLLGNANRWVPKNYNLSANDSQAAPPPPPPPPLPQSKLESMFGDPPPTTPVKIAQPQSAKRVSDLIPAVVRPELWKVNGGKVAEISEYGDRVTVKAPITVHALLEGPRYRPDPNKVPLYINYRP